MAFRTGDEQMSTSARPTERRWVPIQDVLDEVEESETESLAALLTEWVDDPAFLPVTRDDYAIGSDR